MIHLCMIGTTLSNDYSFSILFNGNMSLICVHRFFTYVYDYALFIADE